MSVLSCGAFLHRGGVHHQPAPDAPVLLAGCGGVTLHNSMKRR